MSCFLFKLRFTAPVHFGASDAALSLCSSAENICADTLFSALCHTALRAEGQPGLSRLLDAARRGELRLSDTMPWRGDTLYLPKPFFHSEVHAEVPAARRKAMKKLRWIPVGAFEDFSASVHGGEQYIPDEDAAFGVHAGHTRAAVAAARTLSLIRSARSAFMMTAACGSSAAVRRRTASITRASSRCSVWAASAARSAPAAAHLRSRTSFFLTSRLMPRPSGSTPR